MIKKIVSLILLVSVLTGVFFSACGKNTEENKPEKIEIGFNGSRDFSRGNNLFLCGVKSETDIFNPDDVKMDFYFGHANTVFPSLAYPNPPTKKPDWGVNEGYERVSIALYFYRRQPYFDDLTNIADYRDIKDFYFIKEFDPEEFKTEQYTATYTSSGIFGLNGSTVFDYYETLTIPKEILIDPNNNPLNSSGTDSFYFNLADIWYSEEEGTYLVKLVRVYNGIHFAYKYITDSQIKINYVYNLK